MASGISVCEAPGGDGAHVDPRVVDGVHANAVAQEGAAGFTPGRIGADDGDADVLQVMEHAQDQLIGQGGFAGPPVPVMPITGTLRSPIFSLSFRRNLTR
jgi:hypothetical protein